MRYQLTPIFCRPWLLTGLSTRLIESHYENNCGGALRRLNSITEKLESLDFSNTPPYVVNSLKREGKSVQIIDARPRHWVSRERDIHVGCKTAIALRNAGFDARYMTGGHSAWKAIGGPTKMYEGGPQ